MPRREDERYANLTGKHPVYCTCVQCTDKFLRKKGIRGKKPLFQRLLKGNKNRRHPANCSCATCNLLRSVADLPAESHSAEAPSANKTVTNPSGGLFSKLFRKK